ncbi:MAG: IS1380 family transposase, partial [Bryobacteraceae bacterium]
SGGQHPMGEKQNGPFQLSRVTSDGGLILVRELDERLGFGELIAQHLTDSRRGKNTQLPWADLFRQSVYSRIAGYEDVNDAERLSQDPTFRLIGSKKIWDRGAALTSRLQTFETELLAEEENFGSLARINRELIGKAEAIDAQQRIVLGMDSTEIPVYGRQEQSAYNGHFESTCYHPLLLFNREGDCLAAKLRPGKVHSADDWEELLLPEIERQQKLCEEVVFRADAAFAKPEIYESLEERGVKYTIRIPGGGAVLQQAGDGGTMDQRRQAGGEDDSVELPPVPFQRGAAVVERDGLQPGEPVAEAGATEEDRELVADELAATVGEDRRQAGQTCPLLLADAGREPSDAAVVREHGAPNRIAAGAQRIGCGRETNRAKEGGDR